MVALTLAGLDPLPARLRRAAAFLAGFALLALPWVVFARTHGGAVQFHQLLLFDLYAARDHMNWDDFLAHVWPRFMNDPWLAFRTEPSALLRHVAANLVAHVREDTRQLAGVPLVLAAAAGLVLALLRRERPVLLLAQATAWSYLALVPAGYHDRYALAVLPGYAALAAYALGSRLRVPASGMWALARAAVALAIALPAARASARMQRAVLVEQPLEVLECARVLRSLARPGDRVIASRPRVAWLAGLGTAPSPTVDDIAGLAAAAEREHARWLYVSASEVMLRPRTAFLLDTTIVARGLTRRAFSRVPMRMLDGFAWWRLGVLYELGPELGPEPAGFEAAPVRTLHMLRGAAATLPNAQTWFHLAAAELAFRDTLRAREAWGVVARIDASGAASLVASVGGDTLRALATAR